MQQIEKPSAAGITEGLEQLSNFNKKDFATSGNADATIFDLAISYQRAGLSTIPIKTDGSKRPALSSWKPYEERQPTEDELRGWFGNGKRPGIALIGGKVSGNLEIIDFDAPELIEEWRELVEETTPGLLAQLPQVATPREGLHVLFRCETIAGNCKLAERETEVPEGTKGARQRNGRWFKIGTLIETRGEGGYVITAGSPAACHSSGKLYRLLNGNLEAIPTITPQERDILLTCARSFNEYVKPALQIGWDKSPNISGKLRPGDDFNQRGDVRSLIEKYGWKYLRKGPLGELWQRPGGDHTSATLFPNGSLYVFSTNAAPFDHGHAYSPFAIYAHLEHEGDFKAATKALAAGEYGEPATTKDAKKPAQKRQQVGNIAFNTSETGVWATDEFGDSQWICSQLEIEADTRDEHNENWGRLLKFPDRDGITHQWAMPMSLLAGDGREFREHLYDLGLVIAAGTKARTLLTAYLNTNPDKKALCVMKQGWHRGGFVLPDESFGENSEPIYLQTISANHLFRQSGTVDDWRKNVGQYCGGNSRLILAVSIAFAAPLLEPLQGENGGWQFTGQSSKGKTTALYVAGSVHGGGGDKGFIRRWRATINGLETVAESHHDALLCLDEIAECKPEDVNEASYMLANGQGKTRQSRGGALRRTSEWRLIFLSSGEVSIADHVAQSGKLVRAGQEVRVINLPADAEKGFGLFEELHEFETPDEFARHLQKASRNFYGVPIRSFLQYVVRNREKLRRDYQTFETELLAEMLPKDASSEVSRVAHRFVLIAFAGELATDLGITGWQPDDATAAIKTLFQTWLDSRGTTGSKDDETALRQVRRFIELHGQSRFQRLGISDEDTDKRVESEKINNRAGYVEGANDEGLIYYILPEVFRTEVCAGFDPKIVAKALNQRGCLVVSHDLRYEKRLPEGKKKVYAILSSLLE